MRIAFAGSPESAVELLHALVSHHEVVAVLTKQDAPFGRKRVITPSAVAVAAEQLGIPVIKQNKPTVDDARALRDMGAELCVVVAYGALLTSAVLAEGLKFINLHFSLLPQHRGAAPVQAAILNGDSETGVSIFEIDQGMDTGPILVQAKYPLTGIETSDSLLKELTLISLPLLLSVLSNYPTAKAQIGAPSYAGKFQKSDAQIAKTDSIELVDRKIRALAKEPGVWVDSDVGKVGILSATLEPRPTQAFDQESNQLEFSEVEGSIYLINDTNHAIRLHSVQPSGKPRMSAQDWWRGLRRVPTIV